MSLYCFMAGLFVLKRAASFAIIKEMEREVPCVQMQTLLPDCSVRKLQPVNADIEKIYAMASQNMLFYQYHPLCYLAEHFGRYVRIAAGQNGGTDEIL